jgi:hypothetical protein
MTRKFLQLVAPALALFGAFAVGCSEEPKAVADAEAGVPAPSADDAAVIAAQLPGYPLTTCPVGGKTLGSMGEPYHHVHEGRLVRFCCDGCLKEFNADPAAYLPKIDAAAAAGAGKGG